MRKIILLGISIFIFGAVFFAWENADASSHQQDWCPDERGTKGNQSNFVWDKADPAYGTVTVEKARRNIVGGLVPCGRACDDPTTLINEAADCSFCHSFALFNTIIKWVFITILPAIALLFIVFGGFTILTSRGNPAQSQKGKDMIIWTFAGYAVMFVGWMVLNSFLSGIGVVKWTGLTRETITIQKVHGNLIWTPRTDLDTESLGSIVLEISKSSNPNLVGEKRIIKKIWDENEINEASLSIDCPDGDPGDITGLPTGSDTKDCIETTAGWPSGVPQEGDELKIGGWWQFSCGI